VPAQALPRRMLIGGVLAVAAPALTGCAKKHVAIPKPLPDVAVLTAAMAAEQDLVDLYGAVISGYPALTARLSPMLAHHRDHLTVLRRQYVPGTGEKTPSPSARPQPTTGADQGQALALLRNAEQQAAAGRIADLARVPPGLAQLFACIGACEAGHAALLGGL
jgi:hypothetical protein